ncbi:putative 2OG-Fe(II) oxygenase [Sphingomonas sp. 37zxx]|uniref:putative 2OG-Fe(II) oxygenase n=1 Tax=Sphingomonas sp. 37zxx TaxID=1550073 RepID=UPI000AB41FB6|nr:putative 2OG-Fe(II) oxygenase [Sphingomonas sp. 37zxx]
MTDANALFAAAEQALAAGRIDDARKALATVLRAVGEHPAVLHLAALVEKKAGAGDAAKQFFRRALKVAPQDPAIHGNHANLLGDLGESDAALAAYERALAIAPGFIDARYNHALLLHRLHRSHEALADLERVTRESPLLAKGHAAQGQILRSIERIDEAAAAYDRALAIEPMRPVARHARARIAMERGESDAAERYRVALTAQPDDIELILGLAEAMAAVGDPGAVPYLTRAVRTQPSWAEGHARLAAMRAEAGEGADFAEHFDAAITANPGDFALRQAHWRALAAAGDGTAARAAIDATIAALGRDDVITLIEAANLASETGDLAAAERTLSGLPQDSAVLAARGRNSLRAGDAQAAAALLERAIALQPGLIAGWAHLSLAWRLLGDDRHQWLCELPGLVAAIDLGLDQEWIEQLGDTLRAIHRTRAHPLGQSLRGGTQTQGRLFWRTEPALRALHARLAQAVDTHRRALPPHDAAHPLLRHRDTAMRITGSWSVQLARSGFHVQHIHPEGLLSSALYVALPDRTSDADPQAGWLELGRPPAELGLDLAPITTIEPRVGRLALFPSYLFHGTRPFSNGTRLTVAFDVTTAND